MRNLYFQVVCIWATLFLLLGQFSRVFSSVVVNEVYPNPLTGEDEWVELLNMAEMAADLNGWTLTDRVTSPSILKQFDTNSIIEPHSFLLVLIKNILNNDGDSVILRNALGEEMSTLHYTRSTKGLSWNRAENQGTVYEAQPTPNQPNMTPTPSPTPIPTPTPAPSALSPRLTEVMACPDDQTEWIEIVNPHTDLLSLSGFTLRDAQGLIFTFTDEVLPAGAFITADMRNVLNNNADEIWLTDPENQVRDHFSYTQCTAGFSFAEKDGEWHKTSIITKGAKNIFSSTGDENDTDNTLSLGKSPKESTNDSEKQSTPPTPQSTFSYPPSVLTPHLTYEKPAVPTTEHIYFADPPHLEKGALSVIMGGCLLLIPGYAYVKNRYTFF